MTLLAEKVSTQDSWVISSSSSKTATAVHLSHDEFRAAPAPKKGHEAAVYAYLRAVRAVGKVRVTSGDVASALSLPEREVRRILGSMKERGVTPR